MRAGGSAGRALHQIARPHREEQTQEPTHLLLAEVLKAAPRKRGGAGGDVTITGRRVSVANPSFWQILMKISIFKYTTYKINRPAVCCPVWPSGWTVPTCPSHPALPLPFDTRLPRADEDMETFHMLAPLLFLQCPYIHWDRNFDLKSQEKPFGKAETASAPRKERLYFSF